VADVDLRHGATAESGNPIRGLGLGDPVDHEVGARLRSVSNPDPNDLRLVRLGCVEQHEAGAMTVTHKVELAAAALRDGARV
jgi:hypothetical protein